MNLRILTWALIIAIFLLCLADACLIFNDIKFSVTLKKAVDLKAKAFTEHVAQERRRIKQEMDERFGQDANLFTDIVKNLESEKKRRRELEWILGGKNKK